MCLCQPSLRKCLPRQWHMLHSTLAGTNSHARWQRLIAFFAQRFAKRTVVMIHLTFQTKRDDADNRSTKVYLTVFARKGVLPSFQRSGRCGLRASLPRRCFWNFQRHRRKPLRQKQITSLKVLTFRYSSRREDCRCGGSGCRPRPRVGSASPNGSIGRRARHADGIGRHRRLIGSSSLGHSTTATEEDTRAPTVGHSPGLPVDSPRGICNIPPGTPAPRRTTPSHQQIRR